MAVPRLQLEHVTKSFPGVLAVQDVSLEVYPGEILALVGENGAGKTTLMNVLTGAIAADEGRILIDGEVVSIDSPVEALEQGVTIIHQELALIPQLTVGQNIFLGREPRRRWGAWIDWKTLYAQAQSELDRMRMQIPVDAIVADLPIAQQQLVEIAKALSYRARLIVLDEPTSALTERETERLFALMRSLKQEGVALIYISHRLEEVFQLADRIAVMRDGKLVGVAPRAELTPDRVVQMMVGRELTDFYPIERVEAGEEVLRAEGIRKGNELHGVDLTLRRGEILGVAGLVGAGRTELARVLFGVDASEAGQIWLNGKPVKIRSPQDAIDLGIGFVPEDRKAQGLFLAQTVRSNVAVGSLDQFSTAGVINYRRVSDVVREMVKKLNLRTTGISQRVRNLSGGNQQKVVIARWLAIQPKVLILDEPTRGVDVGAKAEIYGLMSDLAAQGVAMLMISSELPEVLGVSDRIVVMRDGRIVAEFGREEAGEDAIMRAATGQEASDGYDRAASVEQIEKKP